MYGGILYFARPLGKLGLPSAPLAPRASGLAGRVGIGLLVLNNTTPRAFEGGGLV